MLSEREFVLFRRSLNKVGTVPFTDTSGIGVIGPIPTEAFGGACDAGFRLLPEDAPIRAKVRSRISY